MGSPQEELDRLQQGAHRCYAVSGVRKEAWFPAYYSNKEGILGTVYYSALVANRAVEDCFKNTSWDMTIGDGMPCEVTSYAKGKETTKYERFGPRKGVEPLIFGREFFNVRPSYKEVCEEFRLFYNLYHDMETGKLVEVDEDGTERDAAIIKPNTVRIRMDLAREFAALKGMHLAFYSECNLLSELTLQELGITGFRARRELDGKTLIVHTLDEIDVRGGRTISKMTCKTFIPGKRRS